MKKIGIAECKILELDTLKYIKSQCEKYNLRYYLAYGTLIGAIRHKGFIPWDDDIDIQMPREDYDKFIELEHNNPDSRYKLLSPKYNKDYYYSFIKMVDSNTSLLEVGLKPIEGMGIYVDIFPLDKVKNEKSFKIKFMRFLFMLRMAPAFQDYKKKVNNKNRIIFIKILKVLDKIFHFSKGGYYADRCAARNIKKDYAYLANIIEGDYKDVYKKEYFDKSTQVEFEGEYFAAPREYDTVLRKYYGDYMQLPPEDKQKPHHSFDAYYKEL